MSVIERLKEIRILWLSIFANRDWQAYALCYPVTTTKGEVVKDLVMRRWSGRGWEYRKPTPVELEDDLWWWAIK